MNTIDTFQPTDLEDVVALVNASSAALNDDQRTTRTDLEHALSMPGMDITAEVMRDAAGSIIAYSTFSLDASRERAWGSIIVHPDYQGQGIGTALLNRADDPFWAQFPQGMIQRRTLDQNARGKAALANAGYEYTRSFYTMHIDLQEPIIPPPLPDGISFRPFERERDLYRVYEVDRKAFEDHWDQQSLSYERWEHLVVGAVGADTSLWQIMVENEEIIAQALNLAQSAELGYVQALAVLPEHRKRGLGLALLKYSFADLQQRGYRSVALTVDADNSSNAVGLYQRAGMHVKKQLVFYEKRNGESQKK